MTDYGYEDPQSIYSEENRRKATTRTPKEILDSIENKRNFEETETLSDRIACVIMIVFWLGLLLWSFFQGVPTQ